MIEVLYCSESEQRRRGMGESAGLRPFRSAVAKQFCGEDNRAKRMRQRCRDCKALRSRREPRGKNGSTYENRPETAFTDREIRCCDGRLPTDWRGTFDIPPGEHFLARTRALSKGEIISDRKKDK